MIQTETKTLHVLPRLSPIVTTLTPWLSSTNVQMENQLRRLCRELPRLGWAESQRSCLWKTRAGFNLRQIKTLCSSQISQIPSVSNSFATLSSTIKLFPRWIRAGSGGVKSRYRLVSLIKQTRRVNLWSRAALAGCFCCTQPDWLFSSLWAASRSADSSVALAATSPPWILTFRAFTPIQMLYLQL